MTSNVHVEPTHHERHGAVTAHGCQEQRGVLDLDVVMDRDENRECCNGDADAEHDESETVATQV